MAILKQAAATAKKPTKAVAIISYNEKPGIQAIATTAPDLPPELGEHASLAGDYEYKRNGTLSLSKLLDPAYPADTAIKLILDNHSVHIQGDKSLPSPPNPRAASSSPSCRNGSWLNLIEGFFSKLTRSVLRHIRVVSQQELKDRIMAAIDHFNQTPVVHTWSYKLDQAA